MAGSQELYIQPILESNLSVVPGMSQSLDSMTNQLNETTRILMNILTNQGIEQHQAAYSGASLAALALTGDVSIGYDTKIINSTCTVNGVNKINGIQNKIACFETLNAESCNLSNVTSINIQCDYGTQASYISKIELFEGDTITDTLTVNAYDTPFTVPESARKQYDKIKFTANSYAGGSNPAKYTINYTGGNYVISEIPHIAFNANNVLSLKSTNNLGLTSVYNHTVTGYLTIPDQASVATWSSALYNGSDDLSLAIVDNTSHDILKVLTAKTVDISDLQQTTNLAVMVVFPGDDNAYKVLNSFAIRYF